MVTSERIFIAIPVRDRKRIVELCIPTVRAGMLPRDQLNLFNDGSTEFSEKWLNHFSDFNYHVDEPVGIEIQRVNHFKEYWKYSHVFDYLYLTDSDAPHDPSWRRHALGIYHEHGHYPVCLYNTAAHSDEKLGGNTIKDDPAENVIWRKYAPGVSWLLSRDHVADIIKYPGHIRAWDWNCCDILQNRMAVSRESYVDHIGLGGLHHPEGEGLEGGDRALNPTLWLGAKRAEIIKELSK